MTPKVLFVGLNVVDIQYFVDEFPHSNQKIKTENPQIYIGGPATNAAIAFAHLGGEAHLATCIGNHHFSKFIIDDLAQKKVKVIDLEENNYFSPVIATVITSTNSGDRAILSHFPSDVFPKSITTLLPTICEYDYILIDGFFPKITTAIATTAKQLGVKIIFDGGSWKSYMPDFINEIDFSICSENFFPPNCSNHNDVFEFFKKKNIQSTAITRGSKALLWSDDEQNGEIEVDSIKCVDSLGAGDIFHGAFAYYLSLKNSFEKALELASKVASYSCRFRGPHQWLTHS